MASSKILSISTPSATQRLALVVEKKLDQFPLRIKVSSPLCQPHRHDFRVLDRLPVVVAPLAHDLKAEALVHRTRRRVARAHLQDGQTRAARRNVVERRAEQSTPDPPP